jgi:hypothetical protein
MPGCFITLKSKRAFFSSDLDFEAKAISVLSKFNMFVCKFKVEGSESIVYFSPRNG